MTDTIAENFIHAWKQTERDNSRLLPGRYSGVTQARQGIERLYQRAGCPDVAGNDKPLIWFAYHVYAPYKQRTLLLAAV